jgi:tetratricopeptide (TPR) repeat protein
VIAASVGVVEHLSGDTANAIRTLGAVAQSHPGFAMAHYFLGGVRRDAGALPESAADFRRAMAESAASPEMIAGLAQTLAQQGDVTGARQLQNQLNDTAAMRFVSPATLAQVHATLGEVDLALDLLERAVEIRDPELVFVGLRRAYDPLRGTERFERIRKQVGV